MTRRRGLIVLGLLALAATAFATASPAGDDEGAKNIAIRDDCDPRDAGWDEVGGCALKRGDVTVEEFDAELGSPLSAAVIGHQSWRNDPPWLELKAGQTVKVVNAGGRPHTFTKVAQWGGGFVPPLRQGLQMAPECAGAAVIPPGGRIELPGLGQGNHRFICCIHPWMRAQVDVQ